MDLSYARMPPPSPKRFQRYLIVAVLSGVAFIATVAPLVYRYAVIRWTLPMLEDPPVPQAQLARLARGMSKQEVEMLLGPPSESREKCWIYAKPELWRIIYVYFDDNGAFAHYEEHD